MYDDARTYKPKIYDLKRYFFFVVGNTVLLSNLGFKSTQCFWSQIRDKFEWGADETFDRGNIKYYEGILPQDCFVYHKSHTEFPRCELGLPHWY